ncbi:Patellin-4 [Folsomia candida]|uniref:Patellin-4 n=1 Tax=Folsomia candida TaxID=158441 RepID=A0A226ESP6_FOLCA|nr:Patellin-4 [Folsomia candida]
MAILSNFTNFTINRIIIVSTVALALSVKNSLQIPLKDFLTLTFQQKESLEQFREEVKHKVPHDYMKKDSYLIYWLRDQLFNVSDAKELLTKNLAWREKNKMDTIMEEDWADFDYEYRVNIEGCDKEGKPGEGNTT